jgi:LytS/YehU family sensor histidine kinase
MVEDDGDGQEVKPGTGVGLANIRQRLHVLYGSGASLEAVKRERGYIAIIRLPLQRRVATLARVA